MEHKDVVDELLAIIRSIGFYMEDRRYDPGYVVGIVERRARALAIRMGASAYEI